MKYALGFWIEKLKIILCVFGIHKPSPYVRIRLDGKDFARCQRCGKLLDIIEE